MTSTADRCTLRVPVSFLLFMAALGSLSTTNAARLSNAVTIGVQ
jgi:hypothetical protein